MGIGGVMAGPLAIGTEDCKGETESSRGSGSIGSKSDSKADSAMEPRVLLRLGDAMGSRAGSGSVTGSRTPRFPPLSAAVGASEAASAVSRRGCAREGGEGERDERSAACRGRSTAREPSARQKRGSTGSVGAGRSVDDEAEATGVEAGGEDLRE